MGVIYTIGLVDRACRHDLGGQRHRPDPPDAGWRRTWQNVTPPGLSAWSKISQIEPSHFDPAEAWARWRPAPPGGSTSHTLIARATTEDVDADGGGARRSRST